MIEKVSCLGAMVIALGTSIPVYGQSSLSTSGNVRMTTGSKTLARLESDLLDPERKVLTVEHITSSGTRILWTYATADVPRTY
ncbi:MAG: hypothetical protein ACR2IE_12850 [Candidatus Sumerlaeaceae bacterium]